MAAFAAADAEVAEAGDAAEPATPAAAAAERERRAVFAHWPLETDGQPHAFLPRFPGESACPSDLLRVMWGEFLLAILLQRSETI